MDAEVNIRIGSRTDIGRARDLNEDRLGIPSLYGIDQIQQERRGVLVAVADGMGGYNAGEVASQLAMKALFETYYASPASDRSQALRAGFAEANRAIYTLASNDPAKTNMGTTLVAAVIKGRTLLVANVGDSRAHLLRDKRIQQITRDHSWVAEQVREKVIPAEQAREHIYRNVITRAVGNRAEVQVDLFRHGLKSEDIIVLCSDGLNKLEPHEIQQIVSAAPDPDQAAQRLVELANERGGEDNITAVVVMVPALSGIWPIR